MGTVRYELLGPLVVRRDGVQTDLGPVQRQRILAALLLKANQAVTPAELVAAAWESFPPPDADQAVSGHIAVLRDLVDPHQLPGTGELLITLTSGAYVLCVGPGDSDLAQFTREVEQADGLRSVGRYQEARDKLRTALSLWRGAPLAGLNGPVFDAVRQRLTEQLTRAQADLLAAEQELGRNQTSPAQPTPQPSCQQKPRSYQQPAALQPGSQQPRQTAKQSLAAVMIFKLLGAAVPIVTFGMAGWLVTGVLAIRRRSIALALSTAVYLAALVGFWVVVFGQDDKELTNGQLAIGMTHIFATIACAFQAAVVIGRKQFNEATAHLVPADAQDSVGGAGQTS